jgi:LemA protein
VSGFFLAVIMVAVVAIVGIIAIYNSMVGRRILVREGFSGVDVQLKRRHNLIPNLVKTVEGYADFERGVLDDVTRLRTQAMGDQSVDEKQRDESALSGALQNLLAVAENYPDLKANTNFLDLQQNLADIEDALQKARRYYNGTVRDYNTRVQTFPSNLIARAFGFQNEEFFEMENESERAVMDVEFKYSKQE